MEDNCDPNYDKVVEINSNRGRTPITQLSAKKPMTLPNRAIPFTLVEQRSLTPPVSRKKSLSLCDSSPETGADPKPIPQPRVRKPIPTAPMKKANSLRDMRIDQQTFGDELNDAIKSKNSLSTANAIHKKPVPTPPKKPSNISVKNKDGRETVKLPLKHDMQRRKIVEEKKPYEVMEDDIDPKKEKRLPHSKFKYLFLHLKK